MFLAMGFFVYHLKSKKTFLSFAITAILSVEVYAVLNEALQMVNTYHTGWKNNSDTNKH